MKDGIKRRKRRMRKNGKRDERKGGERDEREDNERADGERKSYKWGSPNAGLSGPWPLPPMQGPSGLWPREWCHY